MQGYSVLVGSCFRSTPQIARIVRAGSARGVSVLASIAELIAYSITCAYNFRLGPSTPPLDPHPQDVLEPSQVKGVLAREGGGLGIERVWKAKNESCTRITPGRDKPRDYLASFPAFIHDFYLDPTYTTCT